MDIDKVMPIEDASREKKNRGKNVHFRQDETLRQVRFFHTDDPVI